MAFKKFMQASAGSYSQEYRLHPTFKFACCDCGLVHDIRIGTMMKVRRNKAATSTYRRKMKLAK